MKSHVIVSLAGVLCALVFSLPASAQALRCKNDLANVGDSKSSVLLKCGEPVVKDAFCRPASQEVVASNPAGGTTVNVLPCTAVDEWTYKPGYGQFVTTLRFEDGVLKAITYGDRIK